MAFTDEQPRDGDTILHCGHLGRSQPARAAHWFKFEGSVRFQRPDGSRGQAEWFCACEPCFVRHGEKVADFVRGDGVWTGGEPAIEKPEEN